MARTSCFAVCDGLLVTVVRKDDGDISITAGDSSLTLSHEEAAQLAADLLNIAGVTPVEAEKAK